MRQTPRRVEDGVLDLPIAHAPRGYLLLLRTGLALAAFAGFGLIVASIPIPGRGVALAIAQAVIGAVWWVGVVTTVRRRPVMFRRTRTGKVLSEWEWSRRVSVLTQAAWIVAPVVGAVGLGWLELAMRCVGVAGWAVYAWHLANLAEWARHESLDDRLRRAGMGIALGGGLGWGLILGSDLGIPVLKGLGGFGVLLLIVAAFGIGIFLWSVFELFSMTGWALVNQGELQERDQRFAEKARAGAQKARDEEARRLEAMPAAESVPGVSDPAFLMNSALEPGTPAPIPAKFAGEHSVSRDHKATPYALEGGPLPGP
ncbi:MAG TPA: hypothetical protein DEB06_05330 [Phycisphaerales bacterium]|nr:hypothetical protein [Phycisphaerales bacterium]